MRFRGMCRPQYPCHIIGGAGYGGGMTQEPPPEKLRFPFPRPPAAGELSEIAPGILWLRLPLPFRLNHINIFLIDDGDGWAVLDTGIANKVTREIWEALAAGPLAGRKLTRLIVTHFHPDHIGLAGWLAERFGVPLLTTQTTYLQCLTISLSPGALDAPVYRDFYIRRGLTPEATAAVSTQGHAYLKMVTPLPPIFERIADGDRLKIGGRVFEVITGEGHAPEQAMLYCAEDKLFFAGDQVMEKISPNVSVWAVDPHGDPLGLYLRSLRDLKSRVAKMRSCWRAITGHSSGSTNASANWRSTTPSAAAPFTRPRERRKPPRSCCPCFSIARSIRMR